ncbi:hypothetical protein A3Q56_03752 [Intoshia linei]|uniref:Peptidyl-prolyl cis-trans isomerase n=1 Tax=Intoshia linei TaxID=1819745 RepID=A0A177B472_9BILA|nr:hypothetical protein A3Q56_03752 [Intoshia linei]
MESKLPSGWKEMISKKTGKKYYLNLKTNTSQWEFPATDAGEMSCVSCRHLLVKHQDSRKPSSWREAEILRTKEEAIEIITRYEDIVRSNPAKFPELASQYSDCSSAKRGGDLGEFTEGQMQKSFENAAFKLGIGEISSIVDSASGLHIIQRYG